MSKSEKLAKNELLPLLQEAMNRLDEVFVAMTEPGTEFPAAENSKWVQDHLQFTHDLEARGLVQGHVFKIQAPLAGDGKHLPVLVYNQTKSIQTILPFDEVMEDWMENMDKRYIEGRIWVDGTIQLIRVVEDQAW